MSFNLDNERETLDFTDIGVNDSPYSCEFCSELLIEHSDPKRLTTGQLWICPSCGNTKDDSIDLENIMGTRDTGTVMDGISLTDITASFQVIDEQKGLLVPERNKLEELIEEEFYSVREFRQKGILKDSIQIQETSK